MFNSMFSRDNQKVVLVLAGAIVGSIFTVSSQWLLSNETSQPIVGTQSSQPSKNKKKTLSSSLSLLIDEKDEDDMYMELAQMKRLERTCPPRQSNFRVTAIVVYTCPKTPQILHDEDNDNNVDNNEEDEKYYVVGHNDESCCITNSCCAEKSAFLQLASKPLGTMVSTVYLVSDSPSVITPGVICREFMLSSIYTASIMNNNTHLAGTGVGGGVGGFSHRDTRIVMEGCHGNDREICSLESLFPYPSPYIKLNSKEQVNKGLEFQKSNKLTLMKEKKFSNQKLEQQSEPQPELQLRVKALAIKGALEYDIRDDLHPIRYGAAIIFNDGSEYYTGQKLSLEYGCSQDAICQLGPYIDIKRKEYQKNMKNMKNLNKEEEEEVGGVKPLIICMCDQYGVVHTPFSIGRAYLSESEYTEDLLVLCSGGETSSTSTSTFSTSTSMTPTGKEDEEEVGDEDSIKEYVSQILYEVKAKDLVPGIPKWNRPNLKHKDDNTNGGDVEEEKDFSVVAWS